MIKTLRPVQQSVAALLPRGRELSCLLPALCLSSVFATGCLAPENEASEELSESAEALTVPVLPVVLKNSASGLYADVFGASTSSGAQVGTWSFNGNANQHWQLAPGTNGTYQIISRKSGKCLDVPNNNTSNGQTLQQWSCWGGANQLFSLQSVNGNVQIVGLGSGKCVQGSSQGSSLVIWDCGSATSQQWSVTVAPSNVSVPSSATVQSAAGPRFLDVSGFSKESGAQVWVWSYTGGANQVWSFQAMGDGSYELISENSGLCLDVPGNSTTSGQTLNQWSCWGGSNQRFYLYALGDKVQIAAQGSSKCLSSSAQSDGAALTIQPCSMTDAAQQWSIATRATVPQCGGGSAQSSDLTINVSDRQQKISGFGVSTAWGSNFNDPVNDPDILWSTTKGAGLTLHRIRIGHGETSETAIAQKAVQYGVKVWATPWEVKREYISRDLCPNNSACEPPPKLTNPQAWAQTLADFAKNMKAAGVPIYAISAENEPDSGGMNGTTSFTAAELASWIGSYLGPALAASGTGTKVMGPETMNWWGFDSYFSAIANNADAWRYTEIVASHQYGTGNEKPQPSIAAAGKEYWQTEVDTGNTSDDPTADNMPSALNLAQLIHDDLTKMNLNAFHYWWLYAGGSSGLFNTNTKVWSKRFWVMGNYSRFARPGYVRVGTSGSTPSGVSVSAYLNPADNTLAVVAINRNASAASVPVFISGNVPCTLSPYETSGSKSLGQGSTVTVSGSRVSLSLAAKSVTTFVGKP